MSKATRRFIINKLGELVISLLIVTILSFLLVRLSPIDPAEAYARRSMAAFSFTDEQMEALREKMGLNDSLPVQYVKWIRDAFHLDFARKCGCHDFIMGLEHGYDTIVGGAGGHLSGGERQRIAIARAMLKDAPIIIFDEATAYLDPENESLIQEAISKLVQGKTLIMVAHRLYTVTGADQLVVVNQGRIEATGTHEELLKKCPLYKEMWKAHIGSRDEGGATA